MRRDVFHDPEQRLALAGVFTTEVPADSPEIDHAALSAYFEIIHDGNETRKTSVDFSHLISEAAPEEV